MKRACVLFLVLTGCGSKQTKLVEQKPMAQGSFLPLTEEEKARLHDISFPIAVLPSKIVLNERQTTLTYLTKLSQKDLIDFYRADLECLGWQEKSILRGAESCLVFYKPTKQCIITLRPEGGARRVVIFMGVNNE